MINHSLLFIILFAFLFRTGCYGTSPGEIETIKYDKIQQDTLKENQILYNGRYWRNLYFKVKEDQFLFSKELLPGSVTIDGKSFKNVSLLYDIYNDELLVKTNHGTILQLNKEMVDSFKFNFKNKTYYFTKLPVDSLKVLRGYVNVLFKGKNSLYVKYKKEIQMLAVERKYDLFYQTHRIYFVKDGSSHLLNGKGDLLKVLNEDKVQIRDFIKKNKLRISKKNPESFIPVIAYYDSISK
jgi:hypothetical protein